MTGIIFKSEETYTLEDFLRLIEEEFYARDKQRYELLNGRIVISPPAAFGHGNLGFLVSVKLGNHILNNHLGKAADSSTGFILPSDELVQPDFAFISNNRLTAEKLDEGEFGHVVPNLVVEILSPSTKKVDLGEKKSVYEKNGIDEYWVLDPESRRVIVFQLGAGGYGDATVFQFDDAIVSKVLHGLQCHVHELFSF
jgi:Uma2 family endonuclease